MTTATVDRGRLYEWAFGSLRRPIVWISCPTCWGQRRILEPAGNGEGLVPVPCGGCLGTGEVSR